MKKWLISLSIGALMTGFLFFIVWAIMVMPEAILTILIVVFPLVYFTKLVHDSLDEGEWYDK